MKISEKISNYIQSVRGQTEEQKKRAAITWTVTITVLIFIVWAITFSLSVANENARDARLREEATALAQAKSEAGTSTPSIPRESWLSQAGKFVSDGADSVSTGFWVIGSWLHR